MSRTTQKCKCLATEVEVICAECGGLKESQTDSDLAARCKKEEWNESGLKGNVLDCARRHNRSLRRILGFDKLRAILSRPSEKCGGLGMSKGGSRYGNCQLSPGHKEDCDPKEVK